MRLRLVDVMALVAIVAVDLATAGPPFEVLKPDLSETAFLLLVGALPMANLLVLRRALPSFWSGAVTLIVFVAVAMRCPGVLVAYVGVFWMLLHGRPTSPPIPGPTHLNLCAV